MRYPSRRLSRSSTLALIHHRRPTRMARAHPTPPRAESPAPGSCAPAFRSAHRTRVRPTRTRLLPRLRPSTHVIAYARESLEAPSHLRSRRFRSAIREPIFSSTRRHKRARAHFAVPPRCRRPPSRQSIYDPRDLAVPNPVSLESFSLRVRWRYIRLRVPRSQALSTHNLHTTPY